MKSFHIKFPRRVRIHGGECGAVARALHHEAQKGALTQNEQSLISDECVLKRPAELEKSSNSTLNERKQMSTKTSIKRIALVAVSALGFGLLSVVPAKAAEEAVGTVTAINLTALTANTGTINNAQKVSVGLTTKVTAASGAADTLKITGKITTFPAGGAANVTAEASSVAVATACDTIADGALTFSNVAPYGTAICTEAADTATAAVTIASSAAGAGLALMGFTPTVAGTYVMTVWFDQNNIGSLNDNEVSQTISITVGAAGASSSEQFLTSDSTQAATDGTLAGVKVSSVGIQTIQPSGRVGVFAGFNPRFLLTRNAGATAGNAGVSNATKFATMAFTVTNPAGTAVTAVTAAGGTTAVTSRTVAGSATAIADVGGLGAAQSSSTWLNADGQTGASVFFPMATAGAYTVTLWHDADVDGVVDSGEAITQATFTAVADAAPSFTFTTYGSTVPSLGDADNENGVLIKICMVNGTTKASLGVTESITLSGSSGTFIDKTSARVAVGSANQGLVQMTGDPNAATATLTSSSFDGNGCAYANVGNSTAGGGAATLNVAMVGGTWAGVSGGTTYTVADETTYALATTAAEWGNTAVSDGSTTGTSATIPTLAAGAQALTFTVKTSTATTIVASVLTGTTVNKHLKATVTDTRGLITGVRGAAYRLVKRTAITGDTVTATTKTSFSLAVPSLSSSNTNALTLAIEGVDGGGAATKTITVTNAAAAATNIYVNPLQDAATYSIRAATASKNTFKALVTDQFNNAFPNAVITGAIAGRNSATTVAARVSDANGEISYELSDVYTGTLLLTDTLTFSGATNTGVITVNYGSYSPASKITLTTPDSANATATGIAGSIKSDIDAGKSGASATVATVSAVVADANGNPLPAGVPVTFSVSGNAGAAILSTTKVVNTDSNGKASTSVYAWLNGNATVTATAGGISATGIVYFQQADCTPGAACAEARTVAATVSGNIVTAKVTDRYGNPIKGVTLTASRVGTGAFSGASTTTGTTDAAGSVDFVLTGGSAKVTVAFSSTTFGQSHATKGYVDAGVTAITASAAGTTATAETGVGASYDAAGVNSATVDVTSVDNAQVAADAAADAAAEAIDAANAATDAANLAAEAADAATVAAEEARDAADAATAAVEELATQVATLMAALKAQITTLANTVAKIAKKVKA